MVVLDQRVLKAAGRALAELPARAREVLAHVLVDGGSANTVARRHAIAEDRAGDWVEDARQRFRDRLELQLRRDACDEAVIAALDVEATDRIAREALALVAATVAPAPADAFVGARLGDYTLGERLGSGGMGIVYRAEHATLGRAAVKVLRGEWIRDKRIVDRLFREAQAARMVGHPGVVTVYECGYHDDTPYIAMELMQGCSLGDRLRERGRLSAADTIRAGRQIASVLAAAHALGIAHRDLKPDNIFLVEDAEVAGGERVKVLDFGIAKIAARPGSDPKLTHARDVMGSPAYMAPEQCLGGDVDTRVDVYSLGCTLFELLTGQPPFAGTTERVLVAHIDEAPPAFAADVPRELATLVGEMLVKDRDARIAIRDVLARLRELDGAGASSSALASAPASEARSAARWRRVRRWRRLAGVIASAAVATALIWPRPDASAVVDPIAEPVAQPVAIEIPVTPPVTPPVTTAPAPKPVPVPAPVEAPPPAIAKPVAKPVAKPDLAEQQRRAQLERDLDEVRTQVGMTVSLWDANLGFPAELRAAIERAQAITDPARALQAFRELVAPCAAATARAGDLRRNRQAFATERTRWRDATKLAGLAAADALAAQGDAAAERGELDAAVKAYGDARDTYAGDTTAGDLAKAAGDVLANAERLATQFTAQRDFSIGAGVPGYTYAVGKIAAGKQQQSAGRHAEAKALFAEAATVLANALAEHQSARERRQCIQTDCEVKFQTCERDDVDRWRDKCDHYTSDVAIRSCERTVETLHTGCLDRRQICVDYCNRAH